VLNHSPYACQSLFAARFALFYGSFIKVVIFLCHYIIENCPALRDPAERGKLEIMFSGYPPFFIAAIGDLR